MSILKWDQLIDGSYMSRDSLWVIRPMEDLYYLFRRHTELTDWQFEGEYASVGEAMNEAAVLV